MLYASSFCALAFSMRSFSSSGEGAAAAAGVSEFPVSVETFSSGSGVASSLAAAGESADGSLVLADSSAGASFSGCGADGVSFCELLS